MLKQAEKSNKFESSDGRVDSASTTVAVDLGIILSQVISIITLKLVFTTSLFDTQH